ncbi:MAG: amidohydrolase [Cyclobacteriaceae bacterium]|nr:amidohydrolase [Cyclobacteriaceae bacterium]
MKFQKLIMIAVFAPLAVFAQKEKDAIIKSLDAKADNYTDVARQIWENPELGYLEEKSSALLQGELQKAGFKVEKGVAGIPTAFVASYGSGKPVIGILGEFDALPGMSQEASPERKPRVAGAPGQACGHHLFGTGSMAAAIAVKDWLASSKKSGTIRFYGTPAEEGGSGKVYMVREGLFNDVDAIVSWHAGDANAANPSTNLATISGKFRFNGTSSHAAAAPEQGRSALDGVEAMDDMVNMMREHTTEGSRIHYVITKGGDAPNIVPNNAEVYYVIRHQNREEVRSMWNRVVKCAEGAAIGTETKMEYEIIGGTYDRLPNETLQKAMHANLMKVGGVSYTDADKVFAEKIQKTLAGTPPPISEAGVVEPMKAEDGKASADTGDVSWNVPLAAMRAATWVPGTPAHSWQAVASGGTPIGYKGMMVAAKTLALTAVDLMNDPKLIDAATKEFNERRGPGFKYEALLGNRKPALDYRK